jgi:TonB family protein
MSIRIATRTMLRTMLGAICWQGAVAQQASPPLSPAPGMSDAAVKLEDVDDALANLRQEPRRLSYQLGSLPPDETGRRLQDDIAEYALTEPALARIKALRDELAAANAPGATIPMQSLRPLMAMVTSEACRLVVVEGYWRKRKGRAYHQELIEALVKRLAEPERPAAMLALQAVVARGSALRAQLAPDMRFCQSAQEPSVAPLLAAAGASFLRAPDPLVGDYNAFRMQLATKLSTDRPSSVNAPIERTIPCPAPAATTSGTRAAPRIQPDPQDYYPQEALEFSLEGAAQVRLEYDATGCVRRVTILQSTGVEALDAAARRYAFDYALTPAEVDGNAVGGGAILPINFYVRDMPGFAGRPAAAPQPQP